MLRELVHAGSRAPRRPAPRTAPGSARPRRASRCARRPRSAAAATSAGSAPTWSRIGSDSGSRSALPVSKLTPCSRIMPVSSSSVSFSVTSIGQPVGVHLRARGRVGALCRCRPRRRRRRSRSGSPSRPPSRPSACPGTGRAVQDAVAVGVDRAALRVDVRALRRVRALVEPSHTPSPSVSIGQPFASTVAPFGVPGHCVEPVETPSPSESIGQPVASTVAPAGVSGQLVLLVRHAVAVGVDAACRRMPTSARTQYCCSALFARREGSCRAGR